MIIFRSFAILLYHYYSSRLQRYHICSISQGVYEVLLCRRIQTNQIGTMYEPFSCRIWSFANAEQQILPISMLIFTFVLSMLLRWIVLKHSAIWKLKSNQWFLFTVLDGKYLSGSSFKVYSGRKFMIFQPSCVYLLYRYVIKDASEWVFPTKKPKWWRYLKDW